MVLSALRVPSVPGRAVRVEPDGAVQLLAQDVGVTRVPIGLGEHMNQMLNSLTSGRGHQGT